MRAEAVDDVLFGFVHPSRYRSEGWYSYVARDVERPKVARKLAVPDVRVPEMYASSAFSRSTAAASQPVVPPDGDRIALDQLEEPLQHGLLEDRTRGTPVGVGLGQTVDPGFDTRIAE